MNFIFIFLAIFIFVNDAASQKLQKYNVDPSSITVSGFSSGAVMATQFHFAHSSKIGAAGIFAGVPDYCGIGNRTAAMSCMTDPTNVNVTFLITKLNQLSAYGLIDPVANIQGDKVFIFHGQEDTTVFPESGRNVEAMYAFYSADIKTEFSVNFGHDFPTIGNSGYNGALIMLNHLYDGLIPPADNSRNLTNLLTFNQAEFFAPDPIYSSMGKTGFIYVPTKCRQDKMLMCRLHISFHGCSGYRGLVGNTYVSEIGLIEVAEANNIIVLFPQTTAVPVYNGNGCWDWFGYTNKWFPSKKGKQILGTYGMLTRVVRG